MLLAASLIGSIRTSAAPPRRTAPSAITQVVLERVGSGPQCPWVKDRIVLRRPKNMNSDAGATFARLAYWLQNSGFFSRTSGYADSSSLVPMDIGYLLIKVVRGSQVTQVWSYNGQRDEELSQTETTIRRAAAAMRPRGAKRRTRKLHKARFTLESKNGQNRPQTVV